MVVTADDILKSNYQDLFEYANNGGTALQGTVLDRDCRLEFDDGSESVFAHKFVLAANSSWFRSQLKCDQDQTINIEGKKRHVMLNLVRFCYFGALDKNLSPVDLLDLMTEGEALGIEALTKCEIGDQVVTQLNTENCLEIALHPLLEKYPDAAKLVSEFISQNFFELLGRNATRDMLLGVNRSFFIRVIKLVARRCVNDEQVNAIQRFVLDWAADNLPNSGGLCDIVRDSKQWHWLESAGAMDFTPMMSPDGGEEPCLQWKIPSLKRLMSGASKAPIRFVCGEFFNWCVRLDLGKEGNIRIVYEEAKDLHDVGEKLAIRRFPAAMFAWQVMHRGQNVFHERPVFICFPEGVGLNWSTTLPIKLAEIGDDEEITIMVTMMENPLISLILHYFSTDFQEKVNSEDILNRLPHIEYRCVSSYHISGPIGAQPSSY